MNGIEKANKATTTPTIPQITNLRASSTDSAFPWAVANLKAAKINMTIKKAIAIGHKILNKTSINVLTLRFGSVAGVGPGSNANTMAGAKSERVKVDVNIFLFINNRIN